MFKQYLYLCQKKFMKRLLIVALLFVGLLANAQIKPGITGDSNWLVEWTNFKAKSTEYRSPNIILSDNIKTNTTLKSDNIYLLVGTVRVINNAVLTIEPGTIIQGESKSTGALMICKGSKIIANGSESYPIVFTSDRPKSDRKAGDWGGLILLGNAPTNDFGYVGNFGFNKSENFNSYGGPKVDDSSGILNYVRVEFGGKRDLAGYSANGLSLAGVGSKTQLSNIMVSDSADDSFEVFGGTMTLNKVVSLRAGDDDFDFTEGAQCTISNGLAIRYPYISDPKRSRCLEIESYKKVTAFDPTKKKTRIKLQNVTLLENEINDAGLIKEAIYMNKDAFLDLENVLVTGFKSCIAFDDYYFERQNYKNVTIKNLLVDNCKTNFSDTNDTTSLDTDDMLSIIDEYFSIPAGNLSKSDIKFKDLFIDNELRKQPDFRMKELSKQ